MLKYHTHSLTGSIDIEIELFLILPQRYRIIQALVFFQKVFLLNRGNYLVRYRVKIFSADSACEQIVVGNALAFFTQKLAQPANHFLFKGLGLHNYVSVEIRVYGSYEFILKPYLAVGRLFKQIHTSQKRTLAAARRSYYRYFFALLNTTGYTVEYLKFSEVLIDIYSVYYYTLLRIGYFIVNEYAFVALVDVDNVCQNVGIVFCDIIFCHLLSTSFQAV